METDIRGYTSISEKMEPEEVVALINSYLDKQTEIINNNAGDIDKFVGDAILASFMGDKMADNAVRCAINIQKELEDNCVVISEAIQTILRREGINNSEILERLSLNEYEYFVISAHREENVDSDKNFRKLVNILNGIAEEYNLPVIVSTHPRTKNRINEMCIKFNKKVRLSKPLGFKDFNKLQISSKAVLSDSGTIYD